METALIGLAGVLLGVVLTQGFNLWTEKRRWAREDRLRFLQEKREDRLRFLQDRRRVYAKFSGLMAIAAINTPHDPGAMKVVEEASFLIGEIHLIGGVRVISAAGALWDFNLKHVKSVADLSELSKYQTAFQLAARDEIAPPSEN